MAGSLSFSLPDDDGGMSFLEVIGGKAASSAGGQEQVGLETPVSFKRQKSRLFSPMTNSNKPGPDSACCANSCYERLKNDPLTQKSVQAFNKYSHDEQQQFLFDLVKGPMTHPL